jgi:hypothetical protein
VTYTILKSNGLKYRKISDRCKFLMKKGDVAARKFLQTLHSLRISADEYPIFYLDETWVNQNCSTKYTWQEESRKGSLEIPPLKKGRFIVCHIGSAKNGF